MSWLGPHAAFIVVSYALTAAVMLVLVAWVVVDHRLQTRRLAELEARGVRRRSAARTDPAGAPGGEAAR